MQDVHQNELKVVLAAVAAVGSRQIRLDNDFYFVVVKTMHSYMIF